MEATFFFNTKAQANEFKSELRKCFILTESLTDYTIRIYKYDLIKESKKSEVLGLAKKIYHEIVR